MVNNSVINLFLRSFLLVQKRTKKDILSLDPLEPVTLRCSAA